MNTMSSNELQNRIYSTHHRNPDMNMASQVDLLIGAKWSYVSLYRNNICANVNLDQNTEPKNELRDQAPFLWLPAFTLFDKHT